MDWSGRWNFRHRLRHRHLRHAAIGSMMGLFPVFLMIFFNLWWDVHCTGYFLSNDYSQKRFQETVEMVAPKVEAYRDEYGHLPDSLSMEGLARNWGNSYIDTTRWDHVGIIYYHWDDSAYVLVHTGSWARYISAPNFEGCLFFQRDDSVDSVRVDTLFRQHKIRREQ